jgi:hypothetical protein
MVMTILFWKDASSLEPYTHESTYWSSEHDRLFQSYFDMAWSRQFLRSDFCVTPHQYRETRRISWGVTKGKSGFFLFLCLFKGKKNFNNFVSFVG